MPGCGQESGATGRVSGAGRVGVVTDSTCCLPAELIRAHRVHVVPLRLLAGELIVDDGAPGTATVIEDAVIRGERLTTARPSPDQFAAAYQRLADAGASAVASVHVSARLSGTVSSAELAAASAALPVRVIDSRCIGMGLGLVVLAATAAAGTGLPVDDVAASIERYADQTCSFFALDSPDALLASGRMLAGHPAPGHPMPGHLAPGHLAPGSPEMAEAEPAADAQIMGAQAALVARPLLEVRAGQITMLERVRTRKAAAVRLAELAAGYANGRAVDIAVQHTCAAERAAALADRLRTMIPAVGTAYLTEAGAAIRIHTGPGMLGVALAPQLAASCA